MRIERTFKDCTVEKEVHAFRVEKGVESIHFRLLHGAFEHFFVIVKKPDESVCGVLSFKTRLKDYTLTSSRRTTSNLLIPTELVEGDWKLEVVRTYKVKGGYSIDVEFNLGALPDNHQEILKNRNPKLQYEERTGWYKGDFHSHTNYTDGRISPQEVVDEVKRKELDFFTMSDHSVVNTKFPRSDACILCSTEVTLDDDGHYNIHGLHDFIDYSKYFETDCIKSEGIDTLLKEYSSKGHLISLNHPFPVGWKMKHEYDLRSISLLEVINAPYLLNKEVDNDKAIHFFDYLWLNGHYPYAVGGSDAHRKNYQEHYSIGVPTTKVHCVGLSEEHIYEALKLGRSFIQVFLDFEIELRDVATLKVVFPGEVPHGEYFIHARTNRSVAWELVKNGEVIDRQTSMEYAHVETIEDNSYCRLQARNDDGQVVFFMNPIHHMKKEATEFAFQKVLAGFENIER